MIKIAVAGARAAGAEVTLIDLRDFFMPLYDEDLETKEGLPVAVSKAHEAFAPGGSLKDPKQQAAVEKLGANLAVTLGKLK